MGGVYRHLAMEEVPPAVVFRTRAIRRGGVRQLVHREGLEQVPGGQRFVGGIRRGDIEFDEIMRRPVCGCIPEVPPIAEEEGDAVVRYVPPHTPVRGQATE